MVRSGWIFFNAVKKSCFYFTGLVYRFRWAIAGFYTALTALNCLGHYLSLAPSRNLILSWLLPVLISIFCLTGLLFFCFFLAPYLFQNLLNEKLDEPVIPLPLNFIRKNLRLWAKEMGKIFGLSYLFALLLMIPGIITAYWIDISYLFTLFPLIPGILFGGIQFCRYSLAGHVVLFNHSFKEKQITSALKHSKKLTKGFVFWIFLLSAGAGAGAVGLDNAFQIWRTEPFSLLMVCSFVIEYALVMALGLFLGMVFHQIYLERDSHLSSSILPHSEPPQMPSHESVL